MNIQNIIDTIREFGSIEAAKELIDLQHEILATQQEIQTLLQENIELKSQLENVENIIEISGFYYDKSNYNNPGPFCSGCYGGKNKLVLLLRKKPSEFDGFEKDVHFCNFCRTVYYGEPLDADEIADLFDWGVEE